jgi:uncharacterized OsmC-like protein
MTDKAHPLLFKHDAAVPLGLHVSGTEDGIKVRTAARALQGMQKEALLSYGPTGTVWRMVSDEGPWLNGADLAPFPLGFFTAGLTASYMSEYLTHAQRAGLQVTTLAVQVDNTYTMSGSLLRGTMVGSALPVATSFRVTGSAGERQAVELAHLAVASSPADALLRHAVDGLFSMDHNGRRVPVPAVAAPRDSSAGDPAALFRVARPVERSDCADDILLRLDAVRSLGGETIGEAQGSAVGLQDEQQRQVRVRGIGRLRPDGLKELRVACLQPAGSVFRLLSDDSAAAGGRERAPSGLAYLSAGIAFCFMTQLGRYAQVARYDIDCCRIVQDTNFSLPAALSGSGAASTAAPVDTSVFIDSPEEESRILTLLKMGEQTCYLHAACRSGLKTRIRVLSE